MRAGAGRCAGGGCPAWGAAGGRARLERRRGARGAAAAGSLGRSGGVPGAFCLPQASLDQRTGDSELEPVLVEFLRALREEDFQRALLAYERCEGAVLCAVLLKCAGSTV